MAFQWDEAGARKRIADYTAVLEWIAGNYPTPPGPDLGIGAAR